MVLSEFLRVFRPKNLKKQKRQSTDVGSDHALIRTYAHPPTKVRKHREDRTNRFDMDIDAEAWDEWERVLQTSLPTLTPLVTTVMIDTCVDAIYLAFDEACKATMKRKGSAPAFSSRWWTDDCRDTANALNTAGSDEERRLLNKSLK